MLNNLKIGTKIFISSFIAIVAMIIIIASTFFGLHKINLEINEIDTYLVPLNIKVTELEKDILKEEILSYQLVVASKDVKSEKYISLEKDILKIEASINKVILESEDLVAKAIANTKLEEMKDKYKKFLTILKKLESKQKGFEKSIKVFEDHLKQNKLENIDKELDDIKEELNQMEHEIVDMLHEVEKTLSYVVHQTEEHEKTLESILWFISIISLILVISISFMILKNIKTSINNFQKNLHNFFDFLNRETNEIDLINNNSKDELGLMNNLLVKNVDNIKEEIETDLGTFGEIMSFSEKMADGEFSSRIILKAANPRINHVVTALNEFAEILQKNNNEILSILDEYKNYSYVNRINADGLNGYLKQIADGTNFLGDSICQMLNENKKNGLILDESSDSLLENVKILNTNSNDAASRLEETAAAVEEVSSNIASNTENVVKMASFANKLNISSESGEKLAKETTTSMNVIDEQVNAISEAITVIDQIAFQTNILSLNAAVEAATAGEAGKGFAVVAAEVRNLAARSGEAANEIKTLVENATSKASDGKNIAEEMINGYSELNENISKTIELINQVESASKEQKVGMEQINDAINSLDSQTQNNAAIASQANNVALKSDKIAKLILEKAEEKNFIED